MAVVENEAGPSRLRSTRSSRPSFPPSLPAATSRGSSRLPSPPVDHPAPSPHRSSPGRSQDERSSRAPEDSDTDMDDADADEDYEQQRQRRMKENAAIMESLGISAPALRSRRAEAIPPRVIKRRNRKSLAPVFDRSGYILSLPREGERHRMACVEIPSDRRLRKRIDDGEYQDCSSWVSGEERRWRFGKGEAKLLEGEEAEVGGVGEGFRWRKWRGRKRELQAEQDKLDRLIQKDTQAELPPGVSAYSLIDGPACHQCRRKSDKEKMTCRNIHPFCRAVFCESCCKRYSYFEFDPDARSFICPLCQKCCNCSNCLRKRNLAHLLEGGKFRRSTVMLRERLGGEDGGARETIQGLLDKVMDHDPLPFDRVRLVERDTDVISPKLPPLPEQGPPPKEKASKKKVGSGKKRGRPKKVLEVTEGGEGMEKTGLVIKLKIPRATIPPSEGASAEVPIGRESQPERGSLEKEKMYDSDGDTIAGSSSDEGEGGGDGERSSNASKTPSPPPTQPPIPIDDSAVRHDAEFANPIVPLPNLDRGSATHRPYFTTHRSIPSFPASDEATFPPPRPHAPQFNGSSFTYRPNPHSTTTPAADSQIPPSYFVSAPAILQPRPVPASSKSAFAWPSTHPPSHEGTGPTSSFTYNSFTYTSSTGDTTTYESHYSQSSSSSSSTPANARLFQPIPIPSIQSLLAARISPTVSPNPPRNSQGGRWHNDGQHDHPPPYSPNNTNPHSPSLAEQAAAHAGYTVPPQSSSGEYGGYKYG